MKKLLPVMILIIITLQGCWPVNYDKEGKKPEPHATKTVVVLVDFSGSTTEFRDQYRKGITMVMAGLNEGDAIVMNRIDMASLASAPAIAEELRVPSASYPINNELMRKRREAEVQDVLGKMREDLKNKAEEFLKQPANSPLTEILGAIQNAQKIIRQYSKTKGVVVIFSDMIEESSQYNFRKQPPVGSRIGAILDSERATHQLPDLTGIRFYIIAPSHTDSRRFQELQDFWISYIKAGSGELTPEHYSSILASFDE